MEHKHCWHVVICVYLLLTLVFSENEAIYKPKVSFGFGFVVKVLHCMNEQRFIKFGPTLYLA